MGTFADRVQETTTTTGTGTITLGGALTGFRSFSSVFVNLDRVRYVIAGGAEWEVGEGYYLSSGGLLQRSGQIFSSSNAGALVSLSAGTKAVWVDLPAILIADIGVSIALSTRLAPQ